jgi:hypothetical protein
MKTMTQHLLDTYRPEDLNEAFAVGYTASLTNDRGALADPRNALKSVRTAYGLTATTPPLLTDPANNLKLNKASKPSYGLTLHHYAFRSKVNDN